VPPPSLPLSAVVLAAGRSTRMGRDKALLEADGVSLWQRQRDVVANAGATEIFLSARPDQTWAHPTRPAVLRGEIAASGFAAVLHDAMPGCGPLVGITAGLERARNPLLAVIAVDLSSMTPAWFTSLLADCTPGCGVVGRNGDYYEPLAAIFPQEMKWPCWEALARGEYSLQRLIATAIETGLMKARKIAPEEQRLFANWNEPVARD
jgi:molybdenum cofactor guanylyltransferase